MDPRLIAVAASQAQWSATANRLKARFERARTATLCLSIAGALLAAIASQLADGPLRTTMAVLGTLSFAIVTFLASRALNPEQVSAWTRARAASEALKQEAYKYAALAAPYDGADRGTTFQREVALIEDDVQDLLGRLVDDAPAGSMPTTSITATEYVDRRVQRQIAGFYRPKAAAYQARAALLRRIEFWLAAVTTLLTAWLSVAGKLEIAGAPPFDFVGLTAVLTTISGAILTHIEAGRYDFIVTTYRATARQLGAALIEQPTQPVQPSAEWSSFVARCEGILAQENNSWVAKFGKTEPPKKEA